jgi:hypothetical protein
MPQPDRSAERDNLSLRSLEVHRCHDNVMVTRRWCDTQMGVWGLQHPLCVYSIDIDSLRQCRMHLAPPVWCWSGKTITPLASPPCLPHYRDSKPCQMPRQRQLQRATARSQTLLLMTAYAQPLDDPEDSAATGCAVALILLAAQDDVRRTRADVAALPELAPPQSSRCSALQA